MNLPKAGASEDPVLAANLVTMNSPDSIRVGGRLQHNVTSIKLTGIEDSNVTSRQVQVITQTT